MPMLRTSQFVALRAGYELAAFFALSIFATALAGDLPTAVVPVSPHGGIRGIEALAFGPDGQWLASAGDGTAKIWDLNGRLLRTMTGGVAFSMAADGSVVSATRGHSLVLLDVETGRQVASFKASNRWPFARAALSSDGQRVAASGNGKEDARLYVWDRNSARLLWSVETDEDLVPEDNLLGPRSDPIQAMAFDPHGRWVASMSLRGWIRFWDADTGKLLRRIEAGEGGLSFTMYGRPLAVSGDGKLIAGAGRWDVRIWRVEDGKLVGKSDSFIRSEHNPDGTVKPAAIRGIAFAPDARSLIVSAGGRTVMLDATANNLPVHPEFSWPVEGPIALSPDGRFAALPSRSNPGSEAHERKEQMVKNGTTPHVIDLATSRLVTEIEFNDPRPYHPFATAMLDGETLVAGSESGNFVNIWDLRRGAFIGRACEGVTAKGYVAGRSLAAFRDFDHNITVCEARPGATPRSLGKGPESPSRVMAISPDGNYLVFGTGNGLKIWNVPETRLIADISDVSVEALGFAPTGSLFVISDGSEITLWDAQTGRRIDAFQSQKQAASALRFSDDGNRLLAISSDKARYFDVKSRKLIKQSDLSLLFSSMRAISGDLRWIVEVQSNENEVRIVDAENGLITRKIAVATGAITSASLTADSRLIILDTNDQTIHILDRETGAQLASLYSNGSGQWITMTPEGFFSGSGKGAALVSVVRGLKAVSANQLFQSLYRPDLVREKLAGDPKGLVKAAASRLNLEKVVDSGVPPRVQIAMSAENAEVAAESTTVNVEIADAGGGIGRVEWRIEGVTLGVDTPDSSTGTLRLRRTFALAPGANQIEVVAYNNANLIASLPARATVQHTVDAAVAKPRLYVVVVGVNAYEDPDLRLNFAVPDADALADAFSQAAAGLFADVQVTRIFDADVTRARLESVFSNLSNKVRPQDVLIFFNAGHGKTLEGRYFFIPPSFKLAGEASVRTQGIGQELLQTWFSRIAARRSMFLSDTCESGSLTGDQAETSGAARIAALERLSEATGRIVLTASTEDAPALEGIQGHGVFTFAILDALARGDSNGNGMLEVSEIEQFLRARIPQLSQQYFGVRQVPQTKIAGADFPIGSPINPLVRGESVAVADARGIPTYIMLRGSQPVSSPGTKQRSGDLLARGTKITMVKREGNWSLIAREGRTLGWVPSDSLSPIRFH